MYKLPSTSIKISEVISSATLFPEASVSLFTTFFSATAALAETISELFNNNLTICRRRGGNCSSRCCFRRLIYNRETSIKESEFFLKIKVR